MFHYIVLFILLKASVSALTTGVSSTGDTYICLPIGTSCPTVGFGGQTSVDPRIVTPDDMCPPGYFPCYGIETQCGKRFVDPINVNDGNADVGAHPWQAFLQNATHPFSGSGALLDNFHVLTAAHKVIGNRATPNEIMVHMGVSDPNNFENTQNSRVQEVLIHPSYNAETLLNDIAILRLESPIVFGIYNTINKVCVPVFGQLFNGSSCMVSGWGQTSFTKDDAPTNPQKQVTVEVVEPEVCRESFSRPSLLGSNVDIFLDLVGEICAGGEVMKDACTQDGGSPLVCPDSAGQLSVAGLVIWGKNCGQPGVYGVYVNVPYYSNWIDTTIESLNAKYGTMWSF
ncbi:phenoloxidase-activating factor 2-like isoform X2 [Anthonomus grandis grandis]|uniref:phenoloxidase-activating factor 2-like isoform X2 n=1 Tax=Anthonomus grandis grandis TaxID=2921223 RepID=UPI002165F570|nr:phenoloxidase-activating factor 2-like isoform X2 [Anthonomus grandis grandis]